MCEARRKAERTHPPRLAATSPASCRAAPLLGTAPPTLPLALAKPWPPGSWAQMWGTGPCPDPVLLTPPESNVSRCPEWQMQRHICVHKIFTFQK